MRLIKYFRQMMRHDNRLVNMRRPKNRLKKMLTVKSLISKINTKEDYVMRRKPI